MVVKKTLMKLTMARKKSDIILKRHTVLLGFTTPFIISSVQPFASFPLIEANKMLALPCNSVPPPSALSPTASRHFPSTSMRPSAIRATAERKRLDCPYLPTAPRDLMLNLFAAVDDRLGHALLPSAAFPDILSFQNSQRSAHGSVDIRPGSETSPIDFVLQSWLYGKTPGGGELHIATLFAFLNSSTDAPHLLLQLVQFSPTSLLLLLDLLPRKDLVLHPDYLDEFYQQPDLEGPSQQLQRLPQASPYCSPSLFFRSVLSPTAVSITIDSKKEGEAVELEVIVAGHIGAAVKKIVTVWLEKCPVARRLGIGEGERADMEKRDVFIKRKAIEIDLAANLPRMFGPEVSGKVVADIQKAFKVPAAI